MSSSSLLPLHGGGERWVGDRYARLTAAISEVVEEFGLVSFQALSIEDKESVARLVRVPRLCVIVRGELTSIGDKGSLARG